MSFNIQLMVNSSPPHQLDKALSTVLSVNGTLKEDTSIIDPVIKIQCNLANITRCNYMSIPQFNRYYFITNIKSITNDIVEISAHVDVLNTYKSEIRMNTGIVRRQENSWNLYLNDGTFKTYQNPMVLTKSFPSGFTTKEFVLAVAGGAGST